MISEGEFNMLVIEIKSLTKVYSNGEAKVEASASDKSTLLHLLGGVDKATSGEVIINDKKYIDELLRLLGLENRKNHYPSQLSGG